MKSVSVRANDWRVTGKNPWWAMEIGSLRTSGGLGARFTWFMIGIASLASRRPRWWGAAAAVFVSSEKPQMASMDQSEAFLGAYQEAQGRRWTTDEWEVSWAAGLWVSAFNAKKESLDGLNGPVLRRLEAERFQRLKRAGA